MVIVVIRKNNFVFELTISAACYLEPDCEGRPHIEQFGCCGTDGTNPEGYISGQDEIGPCFPVICK